MFTEKINQIAITGGTHGNEFTGIYLLKQWEQHPRTITRSSFKTELVFANPEAFKANKRYLDQDLNRQFGLNELNNFNLTQYEPSRAKVLNQQLGPKGAARTDLIIDLHNTTSNMGPTLVLFEVNPFTTQLGAYVTQHMPTVVLLLEDHITTTEHSFLCSVAKQGVIVEVGAQPQSVLRQDIMEQMAELTQHILDFVELYNLNHVPNLPEQIDVFRYTETLSLPTNDKGERIGMVHKNLQDADFKPINPGDAIFTLFDGQEVCWQGDYQAYPHFINEAAYYDNNLAMSLGIKACITVLR